MEIMKPRIETAGKALKTLKAITEEPYSIIVRDAAIQRFEYTFETFWKVVKNYLDVQEGIICNSPKSCFKEAFKVNLLLEEETVKILEMVDDRNLTSYTYREEVAAEIYRRIRDYWDLMDRVCRRVVEKMGSDFRSMLLEK
jgi:nucleotidyltransferase substrate binding protein (TIGR01987 family)